LSYAAVVLWVSTFDVLILYYLVAVTKVQSMHVRKNKREREKERKRERKRKKERKRKRRKEREREKERKRGERKRKKERKKRERKKIFNATFFSIFFVYLVINFTISLCSDSFDYFDLFLCFDFGSNFDCRPNNCK